MTVCEMPQIDKLNKDDDEGDADTLPVQLGGDDSNKLLKLITF